MSLLHRSGQVTGDIIALTCRECRERYSGDRLDELLIFEELTCLDPDCRAGGMIPHRRSTLAERFGAAFTGAWTPLPESLMDQRGALGLEPHDLLVIWALERHRRAMGDVVFPGQKTLAAHTGLSVHQVRRALRRLVALELIVRAQPGRKGKGGRDLVQYNLDPLWRRVVGGQECAPNIGEQEGSPTPVADIPFEVGAHQCTGVGAQNAAGWCAESTPEVEPYGIDERLEVNPAGTSPAPIIESGADADPPASDLAVADEIDTDGELWRDFQAWWEDHPRISSMMEAWQRYLAERKAAA